MAAQQEVTAWDEKGKPITTPDAGEAAAWDENGKPIPVSLEPNSAQRFSQVTTGFQHPVDELVREGKDIVHHPLEFGKDLAQTAGIPRDFWSHPIREFKNIGGSGIPGMVFGEHGIIRHPLEFGEGVTGANELSEDVGSGNWKGIPGDIAGGVVNLAALKGPARQLGEQAAGARQALTPMRSRRAPMGAYDENAQSWVPQEPAPEIPASDRRAVPIQNSPKFDPETYNAGRLQAVGKSPQPTFPGAQMPSVEEFYENRGREIDAMRRQQPDAGRLQPVRTSPFGGASSSANPQGDFPLPEPHGNPTPFGRLEPMAKTPGGSEPKLSDAEILKRQRETSERLKGLKFETGKPATIEAYHSTDTGELKSGSGGTFFHPENYPTEYGSKVLNRQLSFKNPFVAGDQVEAAFKLLSPEDAQALEDEMTRGDGAPDQHKFDTKIAEAAKAQGHDGIIYDDPMSLTQQEYVALDDKSIGEHQPIGKRVGDIVNQATGSQPLKANVPLRDQLTAEKDPIKEKYPDPAVRQMVRANGEEIVQAANGNPETLKAIHDLTRVDLRQALINAGEDMGQQTVSNSKFAGEGSIGRQEAFARLLKKGISPEEIVRLAKQTPEGGRLQPVGEEPEIELIEHSGPRGNASGEAGGGGLEEQSRQSSENAQGVKYFRESPGGGRQPLIGIGRQDLRAGPGQKIIRVEANGHETVLDAQPARAGALRPIRGKPRPAGR